LGVRTSAFVGTSLDGFIARTDGALDFLPVDGGEPHGYHEFFASVDALVIGRKTYEAVLDFEQWPYGKRPVFVLSDGALAAAPAGALVERLTGTPADIVRALEERGFAHAYIDGGATIRRFLAAGLLSRLTVTRVPVLIGDGIPLFGPLPADIVVKHVATHAYPSGLVKSEYELATSAAP
jgi:dihydrofolate reductase